MWQTLLTVLAVIAALIFIGRKVYRNLRQAIDPSAKVSCGCDGCSSCTTSCDTKKNNHHES
ncbi:MAG: FeoB-associated Cys-rich membrane protein [Thermodesulfobacteriota bacterium]